MNDIQRVIFDTFLEFIRICEDHDLRYWAIGGTCLGAVRHQGFIPWDDDLDVAMPDEDFRRFMELAKTELRQPYELLQICQFPHQFCLFAKIHDTSTTMIESNEVIYPDIYKGVYIDIMPFCGLPGQPLKQYLVRKKLWLFLKLNHKRRVTFKNAGGLMGKTLWLIVALCRPFLPRDFFLDRWKKTVGRYKFDESEYTGFLWSSGMMPLKRMWFDGHVDMPFETIKIRCPTGWDQYLKRHFGDYMKLPAAEEQIPQHSGGIVDLERSYKHYQEKEMK